MKRSKFSEEQIAYAPRQVEAGTPASDVCRQLGVSEATFYAWKKKFGGMADKMKEHGVSTEAEDKNAKIVKVPAKYGGTEQSGLVYEIKRGGTQTIDIPLQSK